MPSVPTAGTYKVESTTPAPRSMTSPLPTGRRSAPLAARRRRARSTFRPPVSPSSAPFPDTPMRA
jgi:hypothetical protein